MDVIFNSQVEHQRLIIYSIGRARRKWVKEQSWYPVEQRNLFSEMDRIYKEVRAKYGDEPFMAMANERRLNERLWKNEIDDKSSNQHLDGHDSKRHNYDACYRLDTDDD